MVTMTFDAVLTSADCGALFDAPAMVQRMLDVEAALARAWAQCGQLTAQQAEWIVSCCQVNQFDVNVLIREARLSGSMVVPLVARLVELVAARDVHAATFVHAGSTSQDIIDTAVVLATRDALTQIDRDLSTLIHGLIVLARTHLAQPVLARTLMQPAAVQPFGLKVLNWVQQLGRAQTAVKLAAQRALVLQFGGPAGTFGHASVDERTLVMALGQQLSLPVPEGAWHTQRDEWARLGCELAVLCGAAGKLARDWALMSQAEVGELYWEALPGVGVSSAMPHKRNPVAALMGLAAATRTALRASGVVLSMVQEHERALGAWHVELAEWVGLVQAAAGGLSALSISVRDLRIDAKRMREHIEAQNGLVFSQPATEFLSRVVSRPLAKKLMASACEECRRSDRDLRTVLFEKLESVETWSTVFNDALGTLFEVETQTALMAQNVRPALEALWRESHDRATQEACV